MELANLVVLGIDPGKSPGYAVWGADGLRYVGASIAVLDLSPTHCLVEVPQVYPHSRVNPNNLITLAVDLGRRVQEVFTRYPRMKTFGVWPHDWKGGLDKSSHNALFLSVLSQCERDLFPVGRNKKITHDHVDAAALSSYGYREISARIKAGVTQEKYGFRVEYKNDKYQPREAGSTRLAAT